MWLIIHLIFSIMYIHYWVIIKLGFSIFLDVVIVNTKKHVWMEILGWSLLDDFWLLFRWYHHQDHLLCNFYQSVLHRVIQTYFWWYFLLIVLLIGQFVINYLYFCLWLQLCIDQRILLIISRLGISFICHLWVKVVLDFWWYLNII